MAELSSPDSPHSRIVECLPDDLPAIHSILQRSPEASTWSLHSLAEARSRQPSNFLVSRNQQVIEGFIFGCLSATEAEILNVAVDPAFRRKGIGSLLIRELLHRFATAGAKGIFLEVRPSNVPAITLYQRFGFQQIGERPGYYRDPVESALVLRRSSVTSFRNSGKLPYR